MKIARGKMWEFDLETRIFKEAEYKEVKHLNGNTERAIFKKPNHIYCIALNAKNADRKFINMIKKQIEKTKNKI